MGLIESPEIKFARKIIQKHSLATPFDLKELVSKYATLIYRPIPIRGVDGVTLNLKIPGKTPKIIVNSTQPETRQKFTLAHEFGHIIIPWHLGTIIDDLYSKEYKSFVYGEIEGEANRFAAELLMPKDWVLLKFSKLKNLGVLQKHIVDKIALSGQAVAIRIVQVLPKNIIYLAVDEEGIIRFAGKTNETDTFLPVIGAELKDGIFPYVESHNTYKKSNLTYHWWKIKDSIELPTEEDIRDWRKILDDICNEIQPKEGKEKFKRSIIGIVASAHGKTKQGENYSPSTVTASVIYRLNRNDLASFTQHTDFFKFVNARVKEFFW